MNPSDAEFFSQLSRYVKSGKWRENNMKAAFEPVASILRVWSDDDARYGDCYEWCATVRNRSPTEIEVAAYTKKVSVQMWKAIYRECQRLGIRRVLAVTYPCGCDGERRERWIDIKPPRSRTDDRIEIAGILGRVQ